MKNQSRDLQLEKKIDAYLKGHLTEEEAIELWEELLTRPDYLELLEAEVLAQEIVKEQDDEDEGRRGPKLEEPLTKPWKWLAAVAAMTIALAIAIGLLSGGEEVAGAQALDQINIADNIIAPEAVRSERVTMNPTDSLMNLGFRAALSKDTRQAFDLYNEVIETSTGKEAAGAYMNIGILRYNEEDFRGAIDAFREVLESTPENRLLREQAYWFLGHCYLNIGKTGDAREAFRKIESMDGIYRERTQRLLEKLNRRLETTDAPGKEA